MAIQLNRSLAMMGQLTGFEPKILHHHMNPDQRIPKNRLLRWIQEQIDFNFICGEVKDACKG